MKRCVGYANINRMLFAILSPGVRVRVCARVRVCVLDRDKLTVRQHVEPLPHISLQTCKG